MSASDDLIGHALDPAVLESATIGGGRRPFSLPEGARVRDLDNEAWPLRAAALQHAASRLVLPRATELAPRRPEQEDTRKVLPEEARTAIDRLLRSGTLLIYQGSLHTEIAEALVRTGHRVHPFDFPRFPALLEAHPALIGPIEAEWLSRNGRSKNVDPGTVPEPDPTGAAPEDWQIWSPARRGQYANALRREHPGAGRQLIEESLNGANAELRNELVAALRTGLGPEDRELLEQFLKDRSPRVRDTIDDLLRGIPGTEAFEAIREEALASVSIEATRKGIGRLVGAGKRLVVKLPKRSATEERWEPQELFSGLRLSELTAHLDVSVSELRGLTAGMPDAQTAVLVTAANEDPDSALKPADLRSLVTDLPDADWHGVLVRAADLGRHDLALRVAQALDPSTWTEFPVPTGLARWREALGEPLDLERSLKLLRSEAASNVEWRRTAPAGNQFARGTPEQEEDRVYRHHLIFALAALIHAEARPAMRELLSEASPPLREMAGHLLDLHDSLDPAHSTDR